MKFTTAVLLNVISFCSASFSQSQTSESLKGADMLFKNVETRLTEPEKKKVFVETGFVLSGNPEKPFALDKDSKDYPFVAEIFVTDMNSDGVDEVFVEFGNQYTSGMAEKSVLLFIKGESNQYELNLGFPGVILVLPTSYGGYYDLLIGGPGFEYPIWRWDGKKYGLYKRIKNEELEKLETTDLPLLNKRYLSQFKN